MDASVTTQSTTHPRTHTCSLGIRFSIDKSSRRYRGRVTHCDGNYSRYRLCSPGLIIALLQRTPFAIAASLAAWQTVKLIPISMMALVPDLVNPDDVSVITKSSAVAKTLESGFYRRVLPAAALLLSPWSIWNSPVERWSLTLVRTPSLSGKETLERFAVMLLGEGGDRAPTFCKPSSWRPPKPASVT
jgi:hypothetical protein